jgi:hypothetical protein
MFFMSQPKYKQFDFSGLRQEFEESSSFSRPNVGVFTEENTKALK